MKQKFPNMNDANSPKLVYRLHKMEENTIINKKHKQNKLSPLWELKWLFLVCREKAYLQLFLYYITAVLFFVTTYYNDFLPRECNPDNTWGKQNKQKMKIKTDYTIITARFINPWKNVRIWINIFCFLNYFACMSPEWFLHTHICKLLNKISQCIQQIFVKIWKILWCGQTRWATVSS